MKRDVIVTRTAERQMHEAADWYANHDAQVAEEWFNGLITTLNSLENDPARFPLARESESAPFEIRELLYGYGKHLTHRVLFVVRETRVVIHQVRHVAQQDWDVSG